MKTKECAVSSIESARALTQRGFYVVPIPSGKNHPVLNEWQNLQIKLSDLESYFADAENIGILLSPSGLADVDLDCREAIAAADELLPQTAMEHGHQSSPRSHRYYRPTSIPKNKSFHDPRQEKTKSDRAVIAELRTNGQTVVPPSINLRTREVVTWDSEGEVATVNGDVLAAAVAQVAAAALLGRYWPTGSRHFATLALAGMLLRARWATDDVERLVPPRRMRRPVRGSTMLSAQRSGSTRSSLLPEPERYRSLSAKISLRRCGSGCGWNRRLNRKLLMNPCIIPTSATPSVSWNAMEPTCGTALTLGSG
jgi:hypothetical protein